MRILLNPYLLPVLISTLALYWLVLKSEQKRLWLLSALSIGLLAWLHPIFAGCATLLVLVIPLLLKLHEQRRYPHFVITSIIVALLALGLGKYGGTLIQALNVKGDWVATYIVVPLGISYFIFRCLQYVWDTHRGVIKNPSPLRLAAFLFFFPTLPAGPIETYQNFHQNHSNTYDWDLFQRGIRRILIGYFKKLFLVEFVFFGATHQFTDQFTQATSIPFETLSPWAPLGFATIMFFRAYLDLSAYTDIAIGLSALFGYRIGENFRYPFLQADLASFWRSWHISLSRWCRNYVYFPLFGKTRQPWLAVYASMLTMGLWHHLNLNWLFWGLYHATGLVFLSYWQRYKKRHPNLVRLRSPVYTLIAIVFTQLFVALGYCFVSIPNFDTAVAVFKACFTPLIG